MKTMLVSFAVGVFVGVTYGLLRVKSPAPPLVALLGLLGMVVGEHAIERLLSGKSADAPVSSLRNPDTGATSSTR
jgi:XapX domain-containing protein